METINKNNIRRVYQSPAIETIKLDKEISLLLESDPPEQDRELSLIAPENLNNNPYKMA